MGQRDENKVHIKEIKPKFDQTWVPCPICIGNPNDNLESKATRIVKRKSELGDHIFEVKSSKIHMSDIDEIGFGGIIVQRYKENYVFKSFGKTVG